MKTLQEEIKLKIDDYGDKPELKRALWNYFLFLRDYMVQSGTDSFVHNSQFLLML